MLHTKFKHLSQVVLKKTVYEYVLCICMVQTKDPLGQGHFEPRDHCLNKLGMLRYKFHAPDI